MDPVPIPDWIRNDPEVVTVQDFHLPTGSGLSGPPAGAYLINVQPTNGLRPVPMWHVLLEVTDADIEILTRSRILVMACSVVPIFSVFPLEARQDGSPIEEKEASQEEIAGRVRQLAEDLAEDRDITLEEAAAILKDVLFGETHT